ncbi:MAG: histidine kinase dimerization/phospho-acceptor domain-containing protein [Actinomycetota bacterium]
MAIEPPAAAAPSRAATEPGITPGARALYSVATSFDSGTDPEAVLFALVHRCAAAVGARHGRLLTGDGGGNDRVAVVWPDPGAHPPEPTTDQVLRLPLVHAGLPAGTLLLAGPASGAFTTAERRLASALAHPAAAVAAVALRLAAAEDRARRSEDAAALKAEVVGAVDHDLRTPLTTILGALQTLALPEFAPTDPDLAALLSSALAQAKRLRFLLGDLLLASSPAPRREALLPDALRALIADAARSGMGEEAAVPIEVPAGLPPVTVDPPALRRALDGVLRRACRRGLAARVEVTAWGEDAVIAISADGEGPLVPDLSTRLAGAMGGTLDESSGADGTAVVQLVLPGALRPAPDRDGT